MFNGSQGLKLVLGCMGDLIINPFAHGQLYSNFKGLS